MPAVVVRNLAAAPRYFCLDGGAAGGAVGREVGGLGVRELLGGVVLRRLLQPVDVRGRRGERDPELAGGAGVAERGALQDVLGVGERDAFLPGDVFGDRGRVDRLSRRRRSG